MWKKAMPKRAAKAAASMASAFRGVMDEGRVTQNSSSYQFI